VPWGHLGHFAVMAMAWACIFLEAARLRARLTRVAGSGGRELGMLVSWTDILDGEIVNAAWAVAGMAARPRASRRASADLDIAAWADTDMLIKDALAAIPSNPEMPDLRDPGGGSAGPDGGSGGESATADVRAALRRHEVQGALQALLAVRLTDAPEADAVRAREAVRLAMTRSTGIGSTRADRRTGQAMRAVPLPGFETAGTRYAQRLSEYFDDRICALVAALEGRVGFAGLAQVRAEAYNARIVALLGAIERQVAALADPARGGQDEAEFIDRYRRQAHQRHGFLTPPDFDRRRRVPVDAIYVPTEIRKEDEYSERSGLPSETRTSSLTVRDLAGLLDRTVLLGDPGGGKTTAANVLTDRFAGDPAGRIPFLVTLRDYAARTPIEWSVAEHIEQNLRAVYQSPAPDGLVERLMLTGRAVVVFDGLDELLDTSRRRDVSDRVEQFCSAYPLTPVLVTSRAVGYDQARLDDTQFTCYRLGGFGDDEVAEYAGKWFATQDGMPRVAAAAKAQAFLAESAHAEDLRANPLLLSLMCILYRGAGSLPADRAGIYARCAELLLRKWDEQRDLYRKLDADHLVEPTLRYLAWWLFTREDGQTAATERELTAKTAEFLYRRGYESEDEAQAAAREFIEFCRGRMWVFSDAGTTADGEKLYGFTHRTFLEYFTAWHLAVTADSPEDLARALAPHIASSSWSVTCQLAIKIKSGVSDGGADRIYAALLGTELAPSDRHPLLCFLSACLPSVRPAPLTARMLTRDVLDFSTGPGQHLRSDWEPLASLLSNGDSYKQLIAESMTDLVATLGSSGDPSVRASVLRLAVIAPFLTLDPLFQRNPFWDNWLGEQARAHRAEISWAAQRDHGLRVLALYAGIITPAEILTMPGGLATILAETSLVLRTRASRSDWGPYMRWLLATPASELDPARAEAAVAIGRHLAEHVDLPWMRGGSLITEGRPADSFYFPLADQFDFMTLDEIENLGIAAAACIHLELLAYSAPRASLYEPSSALTEDPPRLFRYLSRRTSGADYELEDLPVPDKFKQLFRDWAEGRVNFVEFPGGN
jgi:hypothetical protein